MVSEETACTEQTGNQLAFHGISDVSCFKCIWTFSCSQLCLDFHTCHGNTKHLG